MQVFVTGGTGYVGKEVVTELIRRGYRVKCLVRRSGDKRRQLTGEQALQVKEVVGDLLAPETYVETLRDCDAVIHLVGIIRENPGKGVTFKRLHVDGTKLMVESAITAGVKRFVHMSALGARPNAVSGYHRSKYEAEQFVISSGMETVIFRPSVIFGPGDEFVNMLAGLVKLPVTPVIGNGKYRLQPVSLRNIAELFGAAVSGGRGVGETFDVGGPERISYNDMLGEIAGAMGRKARLMHQPLWLIKPAVYALDRFSFFPVTRNQLTMLLEENIVRGPNAAPETYGIRLIPFAEGIREYIQPFPTK